MRFLIFTFLFLLGCNSGKKVKAIQKIEPNSIVSKNGNLSVKGNQIVNSKGEVVSFAGNSFFWSNDYYKGHSFYNKDVVEWLKKDWNTSIIRIPMAADANVHDSYIYNPKENEEKATILIDAAIALDMYVIIGWHSQHAEDNEKEAISFFNKISKKYGDYPNIIYEIYNEPLKVSWETVIKPYAEHVIASIRKNDPDNIIVVGTPHWSQDVDVVSKNPITNFKNIAYTLHFYAGSHKEWLLNKAKKALDNGIALIVTEWGTVNANGDGAINYEYTQKWMDFMRENNLTHCNWSVHDKEEGASILKPGASPKGGWKDDDLTETGKLVKSYIKNWKK